MKKITFLLLLNIVSNTVFAQEPEVTEFNQVKITYETGNPLSDEAKYEVYLYADEQHSQLVFKREPKNITLDNGWGYSMPFYSYISNYDYATGEVQSNRFLDDGTPLYATWNNAIEWEITDEEKMIGEYSVRKAIANPIAEDPMNTVPTGRAIAWFTSDIPVPIGPENYYGLPGLIVRLEYEKFGYPYVLKSIEPISDYTFQPINKENQVDKEDIINPTFKDFSKIKKIQKAYKKRNK